MKNFRVESHRTNGDVAFLSEMQSQTDPSLMFFSVEASKAILFEQPEAERIAAEFRNPHFQAVPIEPSKTDDAWDALCAAADSPALPVVKTVEELKADHPFARSLGLGPYKLKGVHQGEAACKHCGRAIANIYTVQVATGDTFPVGSECILKLGSIPGSRELVAHAKREKRFHDKTKREDRKRRKAEESRGEYRKHYPAEVNFLETYNGRFDFYLSLRHQFLSKGDLSEKQWACVTNAVKKQAEFEAKKSEPRAFTLNAGEVLIIGKFMAKIIGAQSGLNRPHFALEVMAVEAESQKAWKIRARLSAHRTSHCCVCGLGLTNSVSVVNGIGPICAERFGVSTTEELQAKLMTEYKAEITIWLAKSQVKERKGAGGVVVSQQQLSQPESSLKPGVDYIDRFGDEQ